MFVFCPRSLMFPTSAVAVYAFFIIKNLTRLTTRQGYHTYRSVQIRCLWNLLVPKPVSSAEKRSGSRETRVSLVDIVRYMSTEAQNRDTLLRDPTSGRAETWRQVRYKGP